MPLNGLGATAGLYGRLLNEVLSRPAHAYLFAGPRGVGKRLTAQALVHALLCERASGAGFCCTPNRCPVREGEGRDRGGRGGKPVRCDCCAGCIQIAAGVHPDFIALARAAERTELSIEQVRGLIARLGIRPARAPLRAAIINDAETLNLAAQNALLKTLEEPPGFTIIFLVSESERALLDTVRSRLRLVRFGALSTADIAAILVDKAGIERERADTLAHLARGSAERALMLAEGDVPPMAELVEALGRARTLDFTAAQALAQNYFSRREPALDNFELIARLLEEMLCFKLLGADFAAPSEETERTMKELATRLETATIVAALEAALGAGAAVEAMANPRLQAENWWMTVAQAIREAQ